MTEPELLSECEESRSIWKASESVTASLDMFLLLELPTGKTCFSPSGCFPALMKSIEAKRNVERSWIQKMKGSCTFVVFGFFAGLGGEREGQEQQQGH